MPGGQSCSLCGSLFAEQLRPHHGNLHGGEKACPNLLPPAVPLYLMMVWLGVADSLPGLVIACTTFALVLLNTDAARRFAAGVTSMLVSAFDIEWSLPIAASVMMSLPLVIFVAFLQEFLTRGFGAIGVKG